MEKPIVLLLTREQAKLMIEDYNVKAELEHPESENILTALCEAVQKDLDDCSLVSN